MEGYFDCNATTPLSAAARAAWLRASDRHWQNPSSLYREAGFTAQALDAARERLADCLHGAEAARLLFTSGASESNNHVFAAAARRLQPGQRAALSAIEHPSARAAARAWLGPHRIDELPVGPDGVLAPATVRHWLAAHGENAGLVSLLAASNESGTLQPWPEIAALCRAAAVPFHCDAAQWLGKLPAAGLAACDFLTGSAHKFGGPKGAGFLLLPESPGWDHPALIHGGPQENGRRAGTENYPAIEAMVTALEERQAAPPGDPAARDAFEAELRAHFPGVRLIGAGAPRLWNTSLVVMPRQSNLKWLTRLSRRGFAISTGSACSGGREGSSVVLRALGASEDELRRALRFSGHWHTTPADWQALAQALRAVDAEW